EGQHKHEQRAKDARFGNGIGAGMKDLSHAMSTRRPSPGQWTGSPRCLKRPKTDAAVPNGRCLSRLYGCRSEHVKAWPKDAPQSCWTSSSTFLRPKTKSRNTSAVPSSLAPIADINRLVRSSFGC